jgi:hypothetical protein
VTMKNLFFDAHCHLFNVGDVSLSALLGRYIKSPRLSDIGTIIGVLKQTTLRRTVNLLQVLEKDIPDIIADVYASLSAIDGLSGSTKVLLPQIMDFQGVNCNERLIGQVKSLQSGIREFFEKSGVKDLYIFPFLGIDTRHFDVVELQAFLNRMFDKAINMRTLENGDFMGIKVYPPLGFDPDPENEKDRESVNCLLEFCNRHRIPITCHCSSLGFNTDEKYLTKTNPAKWLKVMEKGRYENLILNLAHFGGRIGLGWSKTISHMITNLANVYTDISYIADNTWEMKRLKRMIRSGNHGSYRIEDKVLFGSDFSIVLLKTNSLEDYLKRSISNIRRYYANFTNLNVQRYLGERIMSLLPFNING